MAPEQDIHAARDAREEELAHLQHALGQLDGTGPAQRPLRLAISAITDLLIWLSTWGDSTRMARDLRQAASRR